MAADYGLLTQFTGPNIRGVPEQLDRSLKLADTIKGRRQKSELTDIFSKNVVQDQQGQSQLNKSGVLTDLYKVQPEKAFNLQEAWGQQDAEMQKNLLERANKELDIQGRFFQQATPNNWQDIKQTMAGLGLKVDNMPENYDKPFVDARMQSITTAKSQFQRQNEKADRIAEAKKTAQYTSGLKAFSDEFLPTIQPLVEEAKNDPKLATDIAMSIWQSPHAGKKYANDFLKQIEPKGKKSSELMEYFMAKLAAGRKNRPIPAGTAVAIGDTEASISQLDELTEKAPSLGSGIMSPIFDPIRTLNPWDVDIQEFNNYIATTKQIIGKGLEGGVLRKEDESKYAKIIPKVGDTPKVLQAKSRNLRRALVNKHRSTLKGLGDANFDISGFTPAEFKKETRSFDSPEEAEAANLKPGTNITINGRKAVWK